MKNDIKILKISRGISFKSIAEKKGKKMSVLTYVYILLRESVFVYLFIRRDSSFTQTIYEKTSTKDERNRERRRDEILDSYRTL